MDYTSVAIIGVVGLIVLWVLWAARGRSGLDGMGQPRDVDANEADPNVHRGERGGGWGQGG